MLLLPSALDHKLSLLNNSLKSSTGRPRVQLLQWKTKDNADHAGLSQPLALYKELTSLPKGPSPHSLNNTSLIALTPMVTMDAEEDSWTYHSFTWKIKESHSRPPTPTKESEQQANIFLNKKPGLFQIAPKLLSIVKKHY